MSNDKQLTIYDVNNSLLNASLGAKHTGCEFNTIESVGDMSEFIKTEFIDVLSSPFLKEFAIDCIIYELNDYKNDLIL